MSHFLTWAGQRRIILRSMNIFPTQECPLCGKVLRYRLVSGVSVYDCPTQFQFLRSRGGVDYMASKSHYEVEYDAKLAIQHIVVLPYGIDTATDDFKSNIFKFFPTELENGVNKWRFITKVPRIKEDTEENLLKRLKNLIPFA